MKKTTSIRLPDVTRLALEELAERSGRDFSSIVNEMLEESLRTRRIPGIVFADGPSGRRARLAGTGLDVFELIGSYRAQQGDRSALRESYPWLSENQLRSALAYAQAYPDEIQRRLDREEAWSQAAVWSQFPFMKP